MTETVHALKFLDADGNSPQQRFAWPLPKGSRPGKWVKADGELEVCVNGIHAVGWDGAFDWFNDRAFVIELDGAFYDETERKWVARRGRLVRELDWNPRLFAYECAKHILPLYEKRVPNDPRVRDCLKVVKRYIDGKATDQELDAARDAAWAAGAAAWAAENAAWAAARGAARDAARAAENAAWAAENAAWAAENAAWAAGAAAWAAENAARDAAWDAERKWQTRRLRKHLDAPEVTR